MTDVPMVLAASETVSNSHPGGSSEARWDGFSNIGQFIPDLGYGCSRFGVSDDVDGLQRTR